MAIRIERVELLLWWWKILIPITVIIIIFIIPVIALSLTIDTTTLTIRTSTTALFHWYTSCCRRSYLSRRCDFPVRHYTIVESSLRQNSNDSYYEVVQRPVSMEPTSPESSSKTPFLSVEQLRWKRLIAFGIENAAPLTTDTTMINRNTASTTSTTPVSSSSFATRPAKAYTTTSHFPATEVIDLFNDDDTTDDEANPISIDISSPSRRPHADLKREYHSTTTPPMLRRTKMKQRNIPNDEKDDDDDDDVHSKLSPHRPSIPVTTLSCTSNTSTEAEKQRHDHSSSGVNFFQVATWNVWFGPWGDGSPHSNIRMKAIVQLLMQQQVIENPLYCIGFQEVVTETMRPLKTLLQQHNYRWFHQPSFNAPYQCGMAIHSHLSIVEHQWIPYSVTVMQRGFLYVRAQLPHHHHSSGHPKEIIFTTTHLESYNGKDYNGAPQRLLQIQEMCQYIQDQMKQHPLVDVAIISGDLNWDDERSTKRRASTTNMTDPVLLSSIPSYWKDTWLEVVSPPLSSTTTIAKAKKTTTKTKTTTTTMVEGYTYDSKLNPMLSGSLRRRFDRILICHNHNHHHHTSNNNSSTNPTSSYEILAPQLLGTEVISPDLTWEKYNMYTKTTRDVPTAPSDHFGYIVTLRID